MKEVTVMITFRKMDRKILNATKKVKAVRVGRIARVALMMRVQAVEVRSPKMLLDLSMRQ